MCKFCETNAVIVPDKGPQLEFGLKTGKFGDIIKLSLNRHKKELHINIDKYQNPEIADRTCLMYNNGVLDPVKDWPEPRYAVWKIKYCPFCGKELNGDE